MIYGESGEAKVAAMNDWVGDYVKNILNDYALSDSYNADETGLFLSDKVLNGVRSKTMEINGKKLEGGKPSKQRITLLHCVNMDGSDTKTFNHRKITKNIVF